MTLSSYRPLILFTIFGSGTVRAAVAHYRQYILVYILVYQTDHIKFFLEELQFFWSLLIILFWRKNDRGPIWDPIWDKWSQKRYVAVGGFYTISMFPIYNEVLCRKKAWRVRTSRAYAHSKLKKHNMHEYAHSESAKIVTFDCQFWYPNTYGHSPAITFRFNGCQQCLQRLYRPEITQKGLRTRRRRVTSDTVVDVRLPGHSNVYVIFIILW